VATVLTPGLLALAAIVLPSPHRGIALIGAGAAAVLGEDVMHLARTVAGDESGGTARNLSMSFAYDVAFIAAAFCAGVLWAAGRGAGLKRGRILAAVFAATAVCALAYWSLGPFGRSGMKIRLDPPPLMSLKSWPAVLRPVAAACRWGVLSLMMLCLLGAWVHLLRTRRLPAAIAGWSGLSCFVLYAALLAADLVFVAQALGATSANWRVVQTDGMRAVGILLHRRAPFVCGLFLLMFGFASLWCRDARSVLGRRRRRASPSLRNRRSP